MKLHFVNAILITLWSKKSINLSTVNLSTIFIIFAIAQEVIFKPTYNRRTEVIKTIAETSVEKILKVVFG